MLILNDRIACGSAARIVYAVLATAAFAVTDAAMAQSAVQATVSPSTVNVGDIQMPTGNTFARVTLTNTGTVDFTVTTVYPGGQRYTSLGCGHDASSFRLITVLKAGEACSNELIVAEGILIPSGSRGGGSAVVVYELNGGALRVPVTVQWNAVLPYLAFDESNQDFGQQQVGTASPVFKRIIQNNTAQPIEAAISLSAGTGPDCSGHAPSAACLMELDEQERSFLVTSDGCHPIPANSSCEVDVRFAPIAAYAMNATIKITSAISLPGQWDVLGTGIPRQTNPDTVLAVEYYDAKLDHYFITASAQEIALLDAGSFVGWTRTGRSFWVFPPNGVVPVGASAVCRFYGRPEAGLDSHFYSASPTECSEVAARFSASWMLESSDVFRVYLPDLNSGSCPVGTTPVYRFYDNRADVDHRYTTDAIVRSNMIGAMWIPEGYGAGIAMCAPM